MVRPDCRQFHLENQQNQGQGHYRNQQNLLLATFTPSFKFVRSYHLNDLGDLGRQFSRLRICFDNPCIVQTTNTSEECIDRVRLGTQMALQMDSTSMKTQ